MNIAQGMFAALLVMLLGAAARAAEPPAPAPRQVYLMRHGEALYVDAAGRPVADTDRVELTERGRAQSRAAGQWLRDLPGAGVDLLAASPLPRAQQSARELLTGLGREPALQTWPELREPAAADDADARRALQSNAAAVLARLAADPDWRRAVLVTHRGVKRALLREVLGGGALERLEFDVGCFCVLELGPDAVWRVRTLNRCPDPG